MAARHIHQITGDLDSEGEFTSVPWSLCFRAGLSSSPCFGII
jgi:hypothetical protein